jgi:hypothetical protein
MARRWIRLDTTWEDSEWLDALDGTAAGCWPRLLCMVKRDGAAGRCKRPALAVLARRWRVPVEAIEALERAALEDDALRIEDGEWVVTAWDAYQRADPTAAERMRRYRAGKSRLSPLRVTPVTARNPVRNPSRDRDNDRDEDEDTGSSEVANAPSERQPQTFARFKQTSSESNISKCLRGCPGRTATHDSPLK